MALLSVKGVAKEVALAGDLAAVAISGNYSDLSGKPTIPSVLSPLIYTSTLALDTSSMAVGSETTLMPSAVNTFSPAVNFASAVGGLVNFANGAGGVITELISPPGVVTIKLTRRAFLPITADILAVGLFANETAASVAPTGVLAFFAEG